MEENKNEQTPATGRKRFFAGILTALISVGGLVGYNYFGNEKVSPVKKVERKAETAKGIGFVNLEKINESHPDGKRLDELKYLEARLRLELEIVMQPILLTPPKIDDKPFDDSVWQKNAQTIIGEAAEIERRQKQAAEDYKKQTEGEYLKKRDEINNRFLNEILNITLKLQNADNMRLKQDEIDKLNERLDELRKERGKIQKELSDQWIEEIKAHAEEAIKADVANLRAKANESMAAVKAEAQRTKEEAERRNQIAMQMRAREEAQKQERQRLFTELQEIINERSDIENKILKDINDETVKLAVIHGLDLIITSREFEEDEKFLPFALNEFESWDLKMPYSRSGAVILAKTNAIDLTDELIKELERQAVFQKGRN